MGKSKRMMRTDAPIDHPITKAVNDYIKDGGGTVFPIMGDGPFIEVDDGSSVRHQIIFRLFRSKLTDEGDAGTWADTKEDAEKEFKEAATEYIRDIGGPAGTLAWRRHPVMRQHLGKFQVYARLGFSSKNGFGEPRLRQEVR